VATLAPDSDEAKQKVDDDDYHNVKKGRRPALAALPNLEAERLVVDQRRPMKDAACELFARSAFAQLPLGTWIESSQERLSIRAAGRARRQRCKATRAQMPSTNPNGHAP
jgi:hypothetical protein